MSKQELTQEDIKLAIEHRDVLLDIRAILATTSGRNFFKYLFKNFEVNDLPELGLEGVFLHDRMGFLRAGNSIFKLVCEADPTLAATILAQKEKDRYDEIVAESKAQQSE